MSISHQKESESRDLAYYLNLKYPIEVVKDEDAYVASVPDLPGCVSYGDTLQEAADGVNEVKELWIKGRLEGGLPVPEPTDIEDFSGKFVLRIPKGLHKSLDREAKQQGVSLNQYVAHVLSERHKAFDWTPILQVVAAEVTTKLEAEINDWRKYSGWGLSRQTSVEVKSPSTKFHWEQDILASVGFLQRPPKNLRTMVKTGERKWYHANVQD